MGNLALPPKELDDVTNTARVLRTLADQIATQHMAPAAISALLRQLSRDLEHDAIGLRKAWLQPAP